MITVIIIVAVAAAAFYLLRPLFAAALALLVICAIPAVAAPSAADPSIGLLLLAIEARRDHLRISEALRLSNPGAPRILELTVRLPEDAAYLTFHRGVDRPVRTAEGFTAPLRMAGGLSEIAYSYAVPSGASATLVRSFPLRVQRLEVVVRGRGVELHMDRGQAAEPLGVGGEMLARWEISALPAGTPVTVLLSHLPVSRPWLPVAGAGAFALLLGSGLTRRLIRLRRHGEETFPV